MAVTMKHKKARVFRDFLINKDTIKMFKEEETDNAVLFRSIYNVRENDKKQFVIIMNDSIYITMQSLILKEVPENKRQDIINLINQIQFEYPTVKYVVTPEGHLMTSIAFHGSDKTMDPATILMCTIEYFKVLQNNHYERFLACIEGREPNFEIKKDEKSE
ncbi:MAG: hypothetical protein ATN32_07570 [Candidatus Epulonipiscium fishelsonii]|nr:MAG: hypothetical protein ATN32_07570 [Epulopiscium sp. AS2M-Bin002]